MKQPVKQNEEAVPIEVIPSNEMVSKRLYSNFVRISRSQHDVTLYFCDVPPIASKEEKDKIAKQNTMTVPIQAEIIIPLSLVEPLIRALTENLKKVEKPKQT